MTENGEREMKDSYRFSPDGRTVIFADGTRLPVISGGEGPEGAPPAGLPMLDPPEPPKQDPPAPTGLTQEEFESRLNEERERVRKEEKDKLYAEQRELKSKVKEFEKREQERQEAEDRARKEAEDQKKRVEEEEMSAREIAERRHQEAMAEIEHLREERDRDRIIMERERELARINEYRSTRIQQELHAETIPAEFVEFVTGTSEEAIEASIARVKAKAEEVFNSMAAAFQSHYGPPPAADGGGAPPVRRPTPFTGAPPADPLGDPERTRKTYSVEDLRSMPMDEYIKNRDQLLAAASQQYYGGRG